MRRLRQLIANARQTVDKAGSAADTYKALAELIIGIVEDVADVGFVQFKFTAKPFGFRIELPDETPPKK